MIPSLTLTRLWQAVTIQPGVEWAQLYLLADQHNRSVAGGFSVNGTVGAGGGWPLGGGHSILSPFFGLGDNYFSMLHYFIALTRPPCHLQV